MFKSKNIIWDQKKTSECIIEMGKKSSQAFDFNTIIEKKKEILEKRMFFLLSCNTNKFKNNKIVFLVIRPSCI